MNTWQFLLSAWDWNPAVLLGCGAAMAAYLAAFRAQIRLWYFLAAIAVVLVSLVSPLNALAQGYLFSAHMIQHILLLLIVPALLILSLPRSFRVAEPLKKLAHPVVGWACGVGAMWLWHVPTLCNAAGSSRAVSAIQSVSLLAMGTIFWWQTAAPREDDRLSPLAGVMYLFAACLACSVLGMIITFSPVNVCSIYMHPVDRLGILAMIRQTWGMGHERDQQVGGLLMWVPMCSIYLAAIFGQLARWYAAPAPVLVPISTGRN